MATNVTVTRVYANPDHFQGKNTPQYVYSGAASSQGGGIQWLGSTLNAVGTYTAPGYITANDGMLWDSNLLSLGTKLTAAKQAADVVVQVGSVDEGAHGAVEIIGNQIINGTIGTLSFHNEASSHARNTVAELAVTRVGDADSGQITLKLADSDANLDDVYIVSELFHNWAVAGVSEMWLSDAALYPNTVGGLTLGTSGAPWGAAFAASALLTGMAATGNRMVYADSTGLLGDLSWLTFASSGILQIGTGLSQASLAFEYGETQPTTIAATAAKGLYIHEYGTDIIAFTTELTTHNVPVRMEDLAGTGNRFLFADDEGDIDVYDWFTSSAAGILKIGTGLTASSLAFEYGGTNPYELSANATDGMYIHLYTDKIMHFTDTLITAVVAVRMDSLAGTGDRMVVADADGDLSTQAIPTGDSSPLTTKGDVYTFSTVDARLPVGTNGQILSADSTETTGLKWIDDTGGTTYTFSNGLTETSGTVALGASLSANVTFTANALYDMSFGLGGSPLRRIYAYTEEQLDMNFGTAFYATGEAGSTILELAINNGGKRFLITSSTAVFIDTDDSQGFSYSLDYSTNGISVYGDRWIPDAGWVNAQITAAGGYTHPNHSGQVTSVGDGAQVLTVSAITAQTAGIAIADTDEFLYSDGGVLKRVDASVIKSYVGASGPSYGLVGEIPYVKTGATDFNYSSKFYYAAPFLHVGYNDAYISLDGQGALSMYADGDGLASSTIHSSSATVGKTNQVIRRGGSIASPSVAPSNAYILNDRYQVYDGTATRTGGYFRVAVDGTISTDNFDTKMEWWIRDGSSAAALGMDLKPAGLTVQGQLFLPDMVWDTSGDYLMTWDVVTGTFVVDSTLLATSDGIRMSTAAARLAFGTGATYLDESGGELRFTDATSGSVLLSTLVAGGSSPWTKTGTNLSPTTADDDILLPAASEIHFGTSTTKIALQSAGTIRVTTNGSEVVDFNSSGNVVIYNGLQTDTTDSSDIGTSTVWWRNIYAQKYVVDDVACYISAPSTAKMALTDGTGTRTLSGLSNYTVVRIQHSDDGVTLDLADLELGAVAWSDITIMMYVVTAFDSSAPQLHIGNTAHTSTYYLAAGDPGWATTGFKTFSLGNEPNFISGDETINCQYNDASSDGSTGDAYLYFSYISP